MLIRNTSATARNPRTYTLGTAALACGANKSTILRSIKAGKIAATRDEHGQWQIEPAELHRVYPAITTQQAPPPDATSEVVALLRQHLAEMRDTLERERATADTWRRAFEDERAQRSLAPPSHPTQSPSQQPTAPEVMSTWRRTWRWMRATG
jgi:hypothetical protein